MAIKTSDIVLDLEGIDSASEAVEEFLAKSKLDRRSQLSARLTFENALLNLRDTFGDGFPAQLVVGSRLGKPLLVVKVRGRRFDPRTLGDESAWEHSLMEAAGLRPSYAYRGGHNIISISCPRPPMGSALKAAIAIVLGLALSRAGFLLPDSTREYILTGLVKPLFDIYVKMLAGVAGPMVFLSVACGIAGIGDMVALGRSGKAIMRRHFVVNLFGALLALVVGIPIYRLTYGSTVGESGALLSITNLILGMFPTNFVEPIVESNTLQLSVLSVAVGIAALALGDLREDGLVREIRNAEGRVLVLEPEGRQTLNLFGDRIRPSAQERLKENAPRWRARFRDERQLPAEWQQTDEGFLVTLRALEAGQETLRIQLTAVNREEAQRFCARWPKQAVSVYGALIHALAGEEET